MTSRGRARGRFPLRSAAYQPVRKRRYPFGKLAPQTVAVGLATETEAALAITGALTASVDTFERADETPLASPWQAWTGSMPNLVGGAVYDPASFGDATYSIASAADAFCEAIFEAAATPGNFQNFGVGVRLTAHSGAANGYMLEIADAGGVTGMLARLYRGATFTTIATGSTINSSTIDGIRIKAVASIIKGYFRISGVWTEVVAATDATYTAAGYAGFWVQDPTFGADVGVEQVSWGTTSFSAQSAAVGLATETESAQAATHVKSRTTGLAAETELAQAATHRKSKTPGMATETETGQVVTPRKAKIVPVGLVVETELAQEIHRTLPSGPAASKAAPGARGRERGRFPMRGRPWVADQRSRGQGTWAQAPRTAQTVSVGIATETELAQSLVNAPRTITVGLAAETETAQRALTARIVASGFPYPVSHVIAGPFIVPGRASETETAQAVAKLKTKAVGRVADTEFALSIAAIGSKVISVGIAAESDAAVAITRTRPVGQVSETDTAQTATRRKTKALGLTAETEAAQAIRPAHSRVLGIAADTETAQATTRIKTRATGEPLEFSTAQSLRHQKLRTIGQAQEQDAALAGNAKLIAVGIATETETAQAATHRKAKTLGQAETVEAAQTLRPVRVYPVGIAGGSELAQNVFAVKVVALGLAGDTGTPFGLAGVSKVVPVGRVREDDYALALNYRPPRSVVLGRPVTRERALPLVLTTGPFTYDPAPGGYVETGGSGHVESGGVLVR